MSGNAVTSCQWCVCGAEHLAPNVAGIACSVSGMDICGSWHPAHLINFGSNEQGRDFNRNHGLVREGFNPLPGLASAQEKQQLKAAQWSMGDWWCTARVHSPTSTSPRVVLDAAAWLKRFRSASTSAPWASSDECDATRSRTARSGVEELDGAERPQRSTSGAERVAYYTSCRPLEHSQTIHGNGIVTQ